MGMSVGAAPKLVHSVRMMLESDRRLICIKLDLVYAFNEMLRAQAVQALEDELSLIHFTVLSAKI